jgi:hypothetical protein
MFTLATAVDERGIPLPPPSALCFVFAFYSISSQPPQPVKSLRVLWHLQAFLSNARIAELPPLPVLYALLYSIDLGKLTVVEKSELRPTLIGRLLRRQACFGTLLSLPCLCL